MEIENENDEESTSITGGARECLMLKMTNRDENIIRANLYAESCFQMANYLCEARVQTVTYYTWYK